MNSITHDIRQAVRSLRRAPGFVLTVVGTIALGVGLLSAAFTVFDAYVLRTIPVRDPRTLYELAWTDRGGHEHNWLSWPAAQRIIGDAAVRDGFAFRPVYTRIDGRPAYGQLVSSGYFPALERRAALGRLFGGDADATAREIVLGYDAWRSWFGADSSVIGKRAIIWGAPVEIIGVAAPGFRGVSAVPPDFYAPLHLADLAEGRANVLADERSPLVRVGLRPSSAGGTIATSNALVRTIQSITATAPDSAHAVSVQLVSLASAMPLTAEVVAIFAPIVLVFALVMATACANVASLMLARGVSRQREMAVRVALGAARGRLLRQLLTESLVLAVPSAILGILLSRVTLVAGLGWMLETMPAEMLPYVRFEPLQPNIHVLSVAAILAVFSVMLAALVPALRSTRPDVVRAARGASATAGAGRLRSALVIAQVAVSALLLATSGVLLRASRAARAVETGLATHSVVQVLPRRDARELAMRSLEASPVVRRVAASTSAPLDGSFPGASVVADNGHSVVAAYNSVSASYFDVLGVSVTRGRGFTVADESSGQPTAVVSESFAQRLWPGEDPIGRVVRIGAPDGTASALAFTSVTVAGVVSNTVSGWIGTGRDRPILYVATPLSAPGTVLLAATHQQGRAVRASLDSTLGPAASDVHALDDFLAMQTYPFAAAGWSASALGAIAFLLTLSGIYGVLSNIVANRTREIGIRMALGAPAGATVSLVVGQSLRLAVIGTVAGVLLAAVATRLAASLLLLVNSADPVGYVVGAAVVLLGALVAAIGPSWRAAHVHPLVALAAE